MKKSKVIKVDYLARVEGEGSLYLKFKNDELTDVKLKIFEPPRFFEAFLRDREYSEAPDITARICGICPIAYQMSAIHAMEDAFGVTIDPPLRELRRLIYCGEWIESHILHAFMLHAPDFLGLDDAIQIAKEHKELIENVLRFKKTGNAIVRLLGGREIHPINVKVGGFYRVPEKKEFAQLEEDLKWAHDFALEAISFVGGFTFPEFEQDYEFVALSHPDEYPFNEGRIVSNRGLDIAVREYDDHFEEQHVEHTTALHSIIKERGNYFVGPMARYNLNHDQLPKSAREAALSAGLGKTCTNPFKSIIIRCVECLFAVEEALRILKDYQVPGKPAMDIQPKAGTGYACTEAPRGILYHRYTVDEKGLIQDAQIVPPTSQNQKTIEHDLWQFIPQHSDLPDDQLQWQCEQAIRNYDPCISCATHFLKINKQEADS